MCIYHFIEIQCWCISHLLYFISRDIVIHADHTAKVPGKCCLLCALLSSCIKISSDLVLICQLSILSVYLVVLILSLFRRRSRSIALFVLVEINLKLFFVDLLLKVFNYIIVILVSMCVYVCVCFSFFFCLRSFLCITYFKKQLGGH